ncbi:MAG: PrsW family intramembrane metalloprotease [Eggerthellaceae bacterium]|nr:PrsW family intramembrane metalloprotease [Eggerthellaceae bacterium]
MESIEVLLAIALIPPIFLLFLIWKVDKLEHEPVKMILIVLGLGAVCAGLALVLEIAVDKPIANAFNNNPALWLVVDNFVGVALMEEISKMLVIMLVVWRHSQFNCRFDGIVYGVAASLGFAALENVKYTLTYGFQTGMIRAFTAIPGHFIFGVFMGAMIGMAKCAKYDGKHGKKNLLLFLAILLPTLIHGYYDYLLSVPGVLYIDTTTLWIGYLIAIMIAATIVIIRSAKHDRPVDKTKGYSGEPLPAATAAGTVPGANPVYGTVSYTPGAYMPGAQGQPQVGAPAQVYVPQAYQPAAQSQPVAQPQPVQTYTPQAYTQGTYQAPKTPLQ